MVNDLNLVSFLPNFISEVGLDIKMILRIHADEIEILLLHSCYLCYVLKLVLMSDYNGYYGMIT